MNRSLAARIRPCQTATMTQSDGFVGAAPCRRPPRRTIAGSLRSRATMLLDIRLPLARSDDDRVAYVARVVRALDRRRLAAVALVTLLLSLGPLFSSDLFDFFSPAEIALAWFEHLVELAVLAAALTAAYTLLDEALPRRTPLRLAILCAMLFGLSVVLTAAALCLLRAQLRPSAAAAALAGRFAALRPAGRLPGTDRRRAPTRAANRFRRTCRRGVARASGARRERTAAGAAPGADRTALPVQRAGRGAAPLSHATASRFATRSPA